MTNLINGERGSGLLVILGAGASFDALEGYSHGAPPLTDRLADSSDIADELVLRYPMARPVIGVLRKELTKTADTTSRERSLTLEEALKTYLERAARNPEILQHVAAFRFYLRDLLYSSAQRIQSTQGGINNYTELVSECRQWALDRGHVVCFVNFNYDPLLEWACESEYKFAPWNLADYVDRPPLYVVKPHGSVLWAWDDPTMPVASGLMPYDAVIARGEPQSTSGFDLQAFHVNQDSVPAKDGMPRGVIPALALPIAGEKSFVWPEEQELLFKERFTPGLFGKILTIGWRGIEPHFIGLLPKIVSPHAIIWTVTANSGREINEVEQNLQSINGPTVGIAHFEDGFSNFLKQNHLRTFLNS